MIEVTAVKTEPEVINIRSPKPSKRIGYKDTTICLSILCAALVNAILIISGFWQTDTWIQLAIASAGTIYGISYILVSASNIIAMAKRKATDKVGD